MFQQVRRYECEPCKGTGAVTAVDGRIVMTEPSDFIAIVEHAYANPREDIEAHTFAAACIRGKIALETARCPECCGSGELVFRLTFGEPKK